MGAQVDSLVDESFFDAYLVSQAEIHSEALDSPISANALNGRLLGQVTHHSAPLSLILSGN